MSDSLQSVRVSGIAELEMEACVWALPLRLKMGVNIVSHVHACVCECCALGPLAGKKYI